MGSLMDLIAGGGPNDPKKGGQGPNAVWNGYQWVPFHLAPKGSERQADMRGRPRSYIDRQVSTPQSDALAEQWRNAGTNINPANGLPVGSFPGRHESMSPEGFARANYGYLAGFLNHPEVGGIIRQAANEGWDEGRLYGAISGTNWWKNTSAAQRTWQQLNNEDPAEARRLVAQTQATIKNRAESLGVNVNTSALAAAATANGWTDAQIVDSILQQLNWATLESGDLTALRDDVKAIGSDYLVAVSDQTAQNYAAKIASGEMSQQGVQSAMLKQAKARFGWMSDQLDAGVTVKDYFRPVQDVIARELGVAAEEIDLSDSKWLKMVERRDEKSGELRAATMDEAMLMARRDSGFANTAKAKEMSTNMLGMVTEMFGRR